MLAAFSLPMHGQRAEPVKVGTAQITGMPYDWSHRFLIFSDPGTEREATWNGAHDQWQKIVNDPRYIMQQLRRGGPTQGPAAADVAAFQETRRAMQEATRPILPFARRRGSTVNPDWAFSLGAGTVAQNMYPAKFTFAPQSVFTTASCATDYVAYGLNVAGTTGASGQSNMVALNELYSGTSSPFCTGHTGPSVYWAYDVSTNGGPVSTSPVLSTNGSDVVFVESVSTGSYLHILVWKNGEGAVTGSSVVKPTNELTAGQSITNCTAGSSCLVSIELKTTSGTSITSSTVTNSSPFYDYTHDIVYVGDDAGNLFKITPVLGSGTPVVTGVNVVSTVGAHTSVMTGPVYDSLSGNVFIGATNGELYAVTASSLAVAGSLQVGYTTGSCSGGYNNALVDAPIVDQTNGWVYEEATTDNATGHEVGVYQSTTGSVGGTTLFGTTNIAPVGYGDTTCNSTHAFHTHAPDFDNTYYTGTVTSGHMWICGRYSSNSFAGYVNLWYADTGGGAHGAISSETITAGNPLNDVQYSECSPIVEYYNTNSTTDHIFVGEGLAGSYAEFEGYTISGTTETALTAVTGYPDASVSGGTSAPVIDNSGSGTEESSVYFTLLNPATSAATCGAVGDYCAIKLTQGALGQ
jgi:hypothetical protein